MTAKPNRKLDCLGLYCPEPVFKTRMELDEMKKGCQPHCFSTLNHNLAYCYDAARVVKWLGKQAARGFQGATGSFS